MKLPLKHRRLNRAILKGILTLKTIGSLIRTYLLTGVFMLIPAAITLYIIYFIFQFSDGILGGALAERIGYQIPGMGLILTALICLLVGMIAQNYVGKRIIKGIDASMEKIPVVKSLYTGIKQVGNVIMQQNKSEFKRVVLLEYPKADCWALGFVTADFMYPINDERVAKNLVSIFVPTTPNPTSGFMLIISKDKIVDLNIDIEIAMKIVISGGLVQANKLIENNEAEAINEQS
ncbi:MAG: DUF502 domain-containing protein [Candidatus Riflebacteria bacterium]|nr:DUF502 domain-containing protein [Candidatus Riflebacteria bacterium]NCB46651.1 DUF502 domain-containing protein [bacterium]NLV93627.1 DUF502 domain-containing protein [Candidatus Riflebacteria bacterium]